MSKATQTVYLTTTHRSQKQYHKDKSCHHLPNDHRPVALHKIDGHYEGCANCVDNADSCRRSKHNEYECQTCGNVKKLPSEGIRYQQACQECQDITTFERV